jgi:hypothetical protein
MGNRTTVQCRFSGQLAADKAQGLINAIILEYGLTSDDGDDPTSDNLDQTFSFYECNYGKIDIVTKFAKANGLSYYLTYGAGHDYGPGIDVYDAATDTEIACDTKRDGEVFLTSTMFNTLVEKFGSGSNLATAIANYFELFEDKFPPLVIGELA